MTEPSSAEAEIDHIDDSFPPPDENTDTSEETVDENDKQEDFNPRDNEGWPDQRPDGGNFEDVAFLPQQNEGVS